MFEYRVLKTSKDRSHPGEYEDAYCLNPECGRAAVADGVSSAIFSGRWARILTEHAVANPPDVENSDELVDWLSGCRAEWLAEVDPASLPWNQRIKLQQAGGAFSTLLWIELHPLTGDLQPVSESEVSRSEHCNLIEIPEGDPPGPDEAQQTAGEDDVREDNIALPTASAPNTPDIASENSVSADLVPHHDVVADNGPLSAEMPENDHADDENTTQHDQPSSEADDIRGWSELEPVATADDKSNAATDDQTSSELTANETEDATQQAASRFRLVCAAIGDCNLFLFRGGRYRDSFPMESAAEFDADPISICSVNLGHDDTLQFSLWETECETGDELVLCSDAIGKACWEGIEADRFPDFSAAWLQPLEAWVDEIERQRSAKEMRRDDSTLVLLRVGTGCGEVIVNEESNVVSTETPADDDLSGRDESLTRSHQEETPVHSQETPLCEADDVTEHSMECDNGAVDVSVSMELENDTTEAKQPMAEVATRIEDSKESLKPQSQPELPDEHLADAANDYAANGDGSEDESEADGVSRQDDEEVRNDN